MSTGNKHDSGAAQGARRATEVVHNRRRVRGTPLGRNGPELLLLVLAPVVHVQIARRFQPVLVHLHGQLASFGKIRTIVDKAIGQAAANRMA